MSQLDTITAHQSRRKLVVIGNGMVSHRLCRGYAEREALRAAFSLTVIGEEPAPAYDRTKLSEGAVVGRGPALLDDAGWYADNGIELRLGATCKALDPKAKRLQLADGESVAYDELVLATGASAFVPPVEGHDLPGTFVYRTHDDVERIREAARGKGVGVVVGGGLLGLEAARVLSLQGLEVHVVEHADSLMSRQLDRDSGLWLDAQVRARGFETHLGKRLERIEVAPDDASAALALSFAGGEALAGDLVVWATGVVPRDELARAAGLRVGARGGAIVDDRLRSSDPHISAVGDCAVHRGQQTGLLLPGYQMVDVLLTNLAGDDAVFERGDTSCSLKLLGIPVATAGLSSEDVHHESYATAEGRRTLVLDGRRLIGATAVGPWEQMPRVREAAKDELRLSLAQIRRFRRTGDVWPAEAESVLDWPAAAVVCNCMGVSRGTLGEAACDGLVTVEALTRRTGAGSVCGSCRPLLSTLAGNPTPARADAPGRIPVWIASLLTLVAAGLMLAFGPLPSGQSVEDSTHKLLETLRDPVNKQITGFSLVGLSVFGTVMSARKRLRWFSFGSFGTFRALHTLASLAALLAAAVHTGLHLGDNLNFALMVCFLAVAVVGAVAGMASAAEASSEGVLSQWAGSARRLRPTLSFIHILLLWPLPLLLGLHIFSVYYF